MPVREAIKQWWSVHIFTRMFRNNSFLNKNNHSIGDITYSFIGGFTIYLRSLNKNLLDFAIHGYIYIYICVCVCARARACVCVCTKSQMFQTPVLSRQKRSRIIFQVLWVTFQFSSTLADPFLWFIDIYFYSVTNKS